MSSRSYICDGCYTKFVKDPNWSPADAHDTMVEFHGPLYPGEQQAILCETCYQNLIDWCESHPEAMAEMEQTRKDLFHKGKNN